MAVAILREFEPTEDRGTPNYDAITKKVGITEYPPDGLIVHTAGFSEDGTFRIFDVWESQEDAERFESDRLMPAIQEFSGEDNAQPINQVTYDLHGVVTGR